jgi:CubicO group peptidase (beta-lactamase class C family)
MSPDADVAGLITTAGFPVGQPLGFAAMGPRGEISGASGRWSDGQRVAVTDLFYAASLTKQVTGAVAALLVASGTLDPDSPIPQDFLPRWRVRPTARQLLHHLGSLPAAGVHEETLEDHWTNASALRIATELNTPTAPIGSAHTHSNVGYVILGSLIERVAGHEFSEIAFRVLPASASTLMAFSPPTSPQNSRLGQSLPLSTGDGGLWTTAGAYVRFLDMQNRNTLGTAHLTQQDALLLSGKRVRYGWGIGLRTFRNQAFYIHGGGWSGCRAKAVRCPALGLCVVVLTAGHQDAAVAALVDSLCVAVAG